MESFLSSYTSRLDAKGRVSVPAVFRALVARGGFEGLLVHESLDSQALDCGGTALLARITGLLATMPAYSQAHDSYATALLGTSEVLKLDGEGRVILPEGLKAHAAISSEVTFVGLGEKFQIWEPGRFRAHLEEARNRLRDLRNGSGVRTVAEPPRASGARE